MAFYCPLCESGSLKILKAIDLKPDSRSDEIVLQVVGCSQCGFKGLASYEESRRGALDSESWDHTGYQVDPADLKTIANWIDSCPDRRDVHCQCQAHQTLRQRNRNGRWNALDKFEMKGSFTLRRRP